MTWQQPGEARHRSSSAPRASILALAAVLGLGARAAASPDENRPEPGERSYPELWVGSRASLIRQHLMVIEALISERAAERAKAAELTVLRARLRAIRQQMSGAIAPGDRAAPELHVVSCYGPKKKVILKNILGGEVRVKVTRKGAPVDLFLSSYKAAHWVIEPAEGVVIRRVFIVGAERPQSYEGVAESRVTGGLSRARFEAGECQAKARSSTWLDSHWTRAKALERLKADTGLSPRTLQSFQRTPGAVVGAESLYWCQSFVYREINALFAELIGDRLAKESAKLRSLAKSWAAKFPDDPLGSASTEPALSRLFPPQTAARARARGMTLSEDTNPYLGHDLAFDPRTRRAYTVTDHDVFLWDLKAGKLRSIFADADPKLSWTCSLTLDLERRRLIVGALHGVRDRLYAYALDTGRWSPLGASRWDPQPRAPSTLALAYDAARDRLYAFGQDAGGGLSITPLSADGRPGAALTFEPNRETLQRRFFGLVPGALPRRTLRGGQLRVHDGKALVCLRVPLVYERLYHNPLDIHYLRLFYAVDLEEKRLVDAGFELDAPPR